MTTDLEAMVYTLAVDVYVLLSCKLHLKVKHLHGPFSARYMYTTGLLAGPSPTLLTALTVKLYVPFVCRRATKSNSVPRMGISLTIPFSLLIQRCEEGWREGGRDRDREREREMERKKENCMQLLPLLAFS